VSRVAELAGGGSQPATERHLAADSLGAGEPIPQRLRSGDDEIAKLNHCGGAGLHGALARDAQQPDRLDHPVGRFGTVVALPASASRAANSASIGSLSHAGGGCGHAAV
jgi:hypothetical protein